jgi:hypothetical protein
MQRKIQKLCGWHGVSSWNRRITKRWSTPKKTVENRDGGKHWKKQLKHDNIHEGRKTYNRYTKTRIRTGDKVQLLTYNHRRIWENRQGNKPKNWKSLLYNSLRTTFLGKKEIWKEMKTQVYQKIIHKFKITYIGWKMKDLQEKFTKAESRERIKWNTHDWDARTKCDKKRKTKNTVKEGKTIGTG